MKQSILKAPLVAFGAATLLSGCVLGSFDASKSFYETYDGMRTLGNEPLILGADRPTGTVKYSGGMLVEQLPAATLAKPVGLAADPAPGDVNYIVAKLDVDVAFDTNLVDVEATNFQRATAPVSIFGYSGLGVQSPAAELAEGDVVLGEKFDGSISGTAQIYDDGLNGFNVDGTVVGQLTTGSGESLKTYTGLLRSDLVLYGTAGDTFLLGSSTLDLRGQNVVTNAQTSGEFPAAAFASDELLGGTAYVAQVK